MYKKLFITLFFDKTRFILLFLFLVTASSCLILKQIDGLEVEPEIIEIPDIEIICNQENMDSQKERNEDTKGIDGRLDKLIIELNKIVDSNTKVYGIIANNLYTFSSPFYQVSFRIYGVGEDFFNQFKNQLAYGTIPRQGKKEVLVGNNAALFYHLEVGDVINEKIGEEYIVSGILKENQYFGSNFYILKENTQSFHAMAFDNMIMIYTSSKQDYNKIKNYINKIKSEYGIEKYIDNYRAKTSKKKKPIKDIILTLIESFLILELVYIYISRGIGKKVGIIKALGISDFLVLRVCGLGFGGLILLTSVITFILSLILFDIKLKLLCFLLLTISIVIFLILFLKIAIMYKKIEPSASMPAK